MSKKQSANISKNEKASDPATENAYELILESISDGVFTVDHNWKITSFNRAAEQITGTLRTEAIGRYCWEVFRSNMCEGSCALKRTMKEGRSIIGSSAWIINNRQQQVPIGVSTAILKNNDGSILGGVETFRDNTLEEKLRQELRRELSGISKMGEMKSRSPAMERLFNILPQIAASNSTVLIEGETGTGKELMARTLHNLSPQTNAPFVAINCGALPDNLLESELFGYKAGAFTDAVKDKPGLLSTAEGGTILLDELGETSPAFQVKLLRVLEEREYQPLGSTKNKKLTVRIIAATNRDLKEMVANGSFRQDLFYRINIIRLTLPPLRERSEDIPLLIDHFICRMNKRLNRGLHKEVQRVSTEAMSHLSNYHYPGNIRELENIIERGFVLSTGNEIKTEHLPLELVARQSNSECNTPKEKMNAVPSSAAASGDFSMQNAVENSEVTIITEALQRNHWNRLTTARDLGIHKSTLFRKIKKLGITLPSYDGRNKVLNDKSRNIKEK